ncbi:MAG: HAD family hydrolase [Candidatus Pacearchaeota archaeon]|nr:HAD family hydrolase [Candidatus Pacearchaeota archaeon]
MIKAYFFDLMGTLIYVDKMSPLKNILPREQHQFLLKNDISKFISSDKNRNEIEKILYSADISIYSDSDTVIKTLKDEGYKLAIISNIYSVTKDKIENNFKNFLNNFDVLTWSCECGLVKPDKEIFTHTLDKLNREYNLNIALNEVVMIGDRMDRDVQPALEIGMKAKLIDRTKQGLEDVI